MACPGAAPRDNRQGAPCPHCAPPAPPPGAAPEGPGRVRTPPRNPLTSDPRPTPPRVSEEGSGTPKATVRAAPWGPPPAWGAEGLRLPPATPARRPRWGAREQGQGDGRLWGVPAPPRSHQGDAGARSRPGVAGAGLGSRTPRRGRGIAAGATRDPRRGAGAAAGPRDGRRASDSAVSFLPRLAPGPAAPGPPARPVPGPPGGSCISPRPGPGCGAGSRGALRHRAARSPGASEHIPAEPRTEPTLQPRARQDGARVRGSCPTRCVRDGARSPRTDSQRRPRGAQGWAHPSCTKRPARLSTEPAHPTPSPHGHRDPSRGHHGSVEP
ncbi:translation initiation factor IF-2-like [Molothrus ater]|uniref:translation initiation factor IF-2-like n=1 Tax=Molothrus ater TaxID=84834 RepID=UPI00174816EE|nr:translation initiation factor IF-2-like [Molothrus ater]